MVHPLTNTTDRYVVGDRFHDGRKVSGHKKNTCKFHNMRLCPELTQFQSVLSEVINSKIKTIRLQSSSQQNIQHYFFYNRLMDHWHNIEIVQKQLCQMQSKLQVGEKIFGIPYIALCMQDVKSMYPLGYTSIKYCNLIGHLKGFKSLITLVIFIYYPAHLTDYTRNFS